MTAAAAVAVADTTGDALRVVTKAGKAGNGSGKPSNRVNEKLDQLLKLMEEENLQELEVVDGPFEVKLVKHGRAPIISQVPLRGQGSSAGKARVPKSPAAGKAAEDFGKLTPGRYFLPVPLAAVAAVLQGRRRCFNREAPLHHRSHEGS
jgi:hypothetical protein